MPYTSYQNPLFAQFGVYSYHSAGYKGSGVKIYVIDSEARNDLEIPNVLVHDFTNTDPTVELTHGSFVTALIASPGLDGNNSGVTQVGICPQSQCWLGAIDDAQGNLSIQAIVDAINDAISLNVDIINASIGSLGIDPDIQAACKRATDAGILFFSASGNGTEADDGTILNYTDYNYPASFSGVISVASCDKQCTISSFSTFNDKVSLVAPGSGVVIEDHIDGQLYYNSGTSFASPFAAGLAGLILCKQRVLSANPNFRYTRGQMVSILKNKDHIYCNSIENTIPSMLTIQSGSANATSPGSTSSTSTSTSVTPSPPVVPDTSSGAQTLWTSGQLMYMTGGLIVAILLIIFIILYTRKGPRIR